jgi:hypothetical protein
MRDMGMTRVSIGKPSCRLFGELRDVHVAIDRQGQRARNGGRRHDQKVRGAPGLRLKRQALVHAETVLLVDDDEAQIPERHIVLEQRMGAGHDLSLARCDARQDLFPRLSLLAAREQRDANARRIAELRQGRMVLAREDFGRHHQRALSAALHRRGECQQRHDRLAGAHVTLEEAQHALAGGHVAQDLLQRPGLCLGEAVGQGLDQLRAEIAGSGKPPPLRALHAGAHEREGELVRQQLVIGEPAACGRVGADGGGRGRVVQRLQRRIEGGPAMALQEGLVLPFGKLRQFLQRLGDGLGQHLGRKPLGQRIDRLDERHAVEFCRRDNVVRMRHLGFGVEPVDLAGDEARLPLGQRPADRIAIGVEEDEAQHARPVGNLHPVGHAPVHGRWGAVAHDGGLDRHHALAREVRDARAETAVDDA